MYGDSYLQPFEYLWRFFSFDFFAFFVDMACAQPSTSTTVPANEESELDEVCAYNNCSGCSMTMRSFSRFYNDEEAFLRFFYSHGVLPCHYKCPTCETRLVKKSQGLFRCRRRIKKKTRRTCDTSVSIYHSSFLACTHLKAVQVAEIVWLYITRRPPRHTFMHLETGLSTKTLVDWVSFIREVLIVWAVNNSQEVGGEGVVIEIEEATIGKRNDNRECFLRDQWVIGGIEWGTKKFFLMTVEDRDTDTLVSAIMDKIKPGTTIFSDCWNDYFEDEDFQNLVVNYPLRFMDPGTSTPPQKSGRMWDEVKQHVPNYGRKNEHYDGYLSECLFMMKHEDHRQRFHEFWKAVAQLHPGLPHA